MSAETLRFRDVINRAHLPVLDGLRAVAVFTVIMGHANYPVSGIRSDLGVSAFFVLSGFLITRLLLREQEATGSISLRRFYLRRTLRIFPAYYAFILLSYALDARQGQRWSSTLLGSALTYTVNYFNAVNHHPTTSIAHAWSLGVEEQFYLLWPLAFMILARRSRRSVIIGATVMALAAIAWRSWLALGTQADTAYLYNAFDTRFDNLAVGCLLALVADYNRVIAAAEWMGRRAWLPLVTIGLLVYSRRAFSEAYHYSIGFTVDAVLVALLIVQLLQLHQAPLWSWLDNRAVRWLGTISYPMYLYHAWGASIGRHLPVEGKGAIFVAGVVATIALASGSYYVIERPFLKLRRGVGARRNSAVTSAGTTNGTEGFPVPLVTN